MPTDDGATDASEERFGFGYLGAAVAGIGAVVVIVAFTAVDWFKAGVTASPRDFGDLHTLLGRFSSEAALIARLYFGWLAWTLLGVSLVLAVAATVPTPASLALRVFGSVAGFAGVALTFLSVRLDSLPGSSFSDYLAQAGSGFYVAASGFLLIAIGASLGPRRLY